MFPDPGPVSVRLGPVRGNSGFRVAPQVFSGYLELALLKGHHRPDIILTSNLEVYKFWDWWIFTWFICEHVESLSSKIWSTVNLERRGILLFYYFVYLKVSLDLGKTNQRRESLPNFIFAAVDLCTIVKEKGEVMVNPDLRILLKRWTEVKTWGG